MIVDKALYSIPAKEVDFKNMPNDEEFYFVIDLAGGKRVHRCGYIKANRGNFSYVLLDRTQLTDEQLVQYQQDDIEIINNKILQFKRENLPNASVAYHYEAEIWAGMQSFIEWVEKQDK